MKILSTSPLPYATIKYSGWHEFTAKWRQAMAAQQLAGVRPPGAGRPSFLYRGVGCERFSLSPKFDRRIPENVPVQQRYNELIEEFERLVTDRSLLQDEALLYKGYNGRRKRFVIEAVAQHRGVPTRLLDWSHSPYVAAFFAFANSADCKSGNVCIWALDASYARFVFREEDFEVIDKYVPKNYRQLYQQGAFTINDTTRRNTEKLFDQDGPFQHQPQMPILFKHVISKRERDVAMEDLELMRIDYTTLFPDMEGISAYITDYFFPRV